MMMRGSVAALLAGALLVAVPIQPSIAQQQNDLRPLFDRIDRLERDVNMLQRQVYQGGTSGGTPTAPPEPPAQGALSSEVRLTQLEDQMRQLNGQIEEINYNLDQLKRRLDTLSSDIDQRFSMLGPGGAAAAAATAGGKGKSPAPPAPSAQGMGNGSGVLGQIPSKAPEETGAPPEQEAAAPGDLPTGSAQEQYNYAFGLLRQANYTDAEQALKTFLQRYPTDPLAGNAQYWLGETYYVRKDYDNAATAFALGYQKYPKSGKAADNLLKLGMALGNLGKKSEACAAFTRLDRDFPTAPANIKERESGERQQVGCP